VHVWQPKNGYRAGVDPVLLAAACPARPGDRVLELGCGVGVASLCLATRVDAVSVTGIERQADYAALARRNALRLHCRWTSWRPTSPIYRPICAGCPLTTSSPTPPIFLPGRALARRIGDGTIPFARTRHFVWLKVARARLKPRGWLTIVQQHPKAARCAGIVGRLRHDLRSGPAIAPWPCVRQVPLAGAKGWAGAVSPLGTHSCA
jgi:tRNA1Val (adenine37-N6)-methyltransferase